MIINFDMFLPFRRLGSNKVNEKLIVTEDSIGTLKRSISIVNQECIF